MSTAAAPRGLGAAGRRLWRSVLSTFDLDEHELALLRQACRVADACDVLQALVDDEGMLRGDRVHPALVELRQQRILLARLVVALRVPLGEDGEVSDGTRLQRRPLRGVYGIGGAA